jgi:uncharacterized lipoprotein
VSRHRKTLELVFRSSGNVKWTKVAAMLKHFGATIDEREGSRIAVVLGDNVAVFHKPHPSPDRSKGSVFSPRCFLRKSGIEA